MPSTGFLRRSVKVLSAQAAQKTRHQHSGRQRIVAVVGGIAVSVAVFFLLKGAAMASGIGLPDGAGAALWLAGPDPISSALGTALQPLFSARG